MPVLGVIVQTSVNCQTSKSICILKQMIFIKYLTPEFPFDQQQDRQIKKRCWTVAIFHTYANCSGHICSMISMAQVQPLVLVTSQRKSQVPWKLEKKFGLVVNTSKQTWKLMCQKHEPSRQNKKLKWERGGLWGEKEMTKVMQILCCININGRETNHQQWCMGAGFSNNPTSAILQPGVMTTFGV